VPQMESYLANDYRNRKYKIILRFGIGIFLCQICFGDLHAQPAMRWNPNYPESKAFSRMLYSVSKLQNFTKYAEIFELLDVPIPTDGDSPDDLYYHGNIKWIKFLRVAMVNNDSLPFLGLSGRVLKIDLRIIGDVFCANPSDLNMIFGSDFQNVPFLREPINKADDEEKNNHSDQKNNGPVSELFTINKENKTFLTLDFYNGCLDEAQFIVKCQTNTTCPMGKSL
jgi:hypothetical protein